MKKCLVVILFILLSSMQGGVVQAGGGQSYPNGAEAFFAGMAPPPGFTFVNYFQYYRADKLRGSGGERLPFFDKATVIADVMRVIWFSEKKLLGGNYGQHFFLPVLHVDLDFKVPVGPRARRHYSDTNVPFFIYSPFLLQWHTLGGKLHFVTSLADIYIPLYNEDRRNLASVGRNFWTIEPAVGVTWLPTKRWEASIKLMYDFNTKQRRVPLGAGIEVDRTPGQEFHFDYNVSYAILDNFRLGVNGYYYQQVTDDRFDLGGIPKDSSRVWAVGPGIWYQHKNIFLTLRSQFETAARDMTEGYKVWFKFIYVF